MAIRKNYPNSFINKSGMLTRFLLVLLLLVFTIVSGAILIRITTRSKISADTTTPMIYLDPKDASIPTNATTTTNLMIDAKSNKISFADVNIKFDQTKVKLASEVRLGTGLKQLILSTTAAEANRTGVLRIVAGLDPKDLVTVPTGVFELATITWLKNTAAINLLTPVNIQTESTSIVSLTALSKLTFGTRPFTFLVNSSGINTTATTYKGSVDLLSPGVVTGWACDKTKPNVPLKIVVKHKNGDVTTQVNLIADISRGQTVATTCGSSHTMHGFRFEPGFFWVRGSSVRIYVSKSDGSLIELPNSPRLLK